MCIMYGVTTSLKVAKELLYEALVQCKAVDVPRHIKRQGGNRLKLNVDDLVKLLTSLMSRT